MRLVIALLLAMTPPAAAGDAPVKAVTPAAAVAAAAANAANATSAPAAPAGVPDLALLRARLPSGEFESLAARTGESDLVCVAEALEVRENGTADCRVSQVLKGELKDPTIRVLYARTFGGVWPQKRVEAVFFLKKAPPAKAGFFSRALPTFRMTSDTGALAAPTDSRLAVVRLAAQGRPELLETPRAARLDLPAPDSLEGMALDAAYVVLGTIQEVALPAAGSKSADSAARLEFRVEQTLKGDLALGLLPNVYLPAARPEFIGPGLKPLVPRVGPAALFLRPEKKGGAYRLLSPYRGYVAGGGADDLGRRLAPAMVAEQRLRSLGLIGNTGGHDSVSDTIKTWMDAWNTKTGIENLVACYSRRSTWRRKWESGPEARLDLARTMATYPGVINVLCDRVDEKDKTTAVAAVRIQVIVTDPVNRTDATEVRSVEMVFVHENSQWLILEEGN